MSIVNHVCVTDLDFVYTGFVANPKANGCMVSGTSRSIVAKLPTGASGMNCRTPVVRLGYNSWSADSAYSAAVIDRR